MYSVNKLLLIYSNEEKAKFAEVTSLMSKYDKAEARAKWLASPEYALQQE